MGPGSPRLLAAGAVRGAAELWRRSVSIGAALAEARQRAGLTVAQVSERTRIRETVIWGIERDDYSGCGGDFYARGHIRGIAKAVGADPGPLVEEYDAVLPVAGGVVDSKPGGVAGHVGPGSAPTSAGPACGVGAGSRRPFGAAAPGRLARSA